MRELDRRAALKRLAASGAAVAGAGVVVSSPAFADGGTASRRPVCGTGGATYFTWTSAGNINHIRFPTVADTVTCSTGWTGSRMFRFILTSGTGVFRIGTGSSLGTDTGFIYVTSSPGTSAIAAASSVRLTDAADSAALAAQATIAVTVIVRRVCTNDATSSRKAYCCTSYSKSATWTRGATDTWGGAESGNFGTGTTPVSSGSGCTAP